MKHLLQIIGILLLTFSCNTQSEKLEIKSLTTSFENAKEYETKSSKLWNFDKEKYDKNRDITFDAYLMNINSSIQNNTNEKIDNASIRVKIKLEYKSKDLTLDYGKRSVFNGLEHLTWNENTIKESKHKVIMNDNSHFNRTLFIHTPERVTLELYGYASNSVGLNLTELLLAEKDITTDWKKLETELKN
jgi:ribosomal protein L21